MIYLDNSATTKPCKEAVQAVTIALTEQWANPSGLYNFGIDAARTLREARHKVASTFGAEPDRVFLPPVVQKRITGQFLVPPSVLAKRKSTSLPPPSSIMLSSTV